MNGFAMPTTSLNGTRAIQVIRVFLGSPGDLGPERVAARDAVEEINRTVARPAGFQIDLVGWEDTLSTVGRPQAIINKDLDTCQVFIGLIWERWGTPPSKDGPYTSGFEEEYLRSLNRLKETGQPLIRLFFKDVDASKERDAGPELNKVLEFKRKIISEKEILFQTFNAPAGFAQHVRIGLADFINRLSETDGGDHTINNDKSAGADASTVAKPANRPTATAGETKLLEDVAASIADTDGEGVDAVAVARIRNLAVALGGSANDTTSLGPHDANLLYNAKADLDLSTRELSGLVDAGVDSFTEENSPLWSWLAGRMGTFPNWLTTTSMLGPEKRRINAFKVMRLLQQPVLEISENFSRADVVQWWFDDTSDRLKVAALEYLAEFGTLDDVEIIRAELGKANYGTRGAAQKALIALLLREDTSAAAELLVGPTDYLLDREFLATATGILPQLSTDKLLGALTAGMAAVRLRALQCLNERDALPKETLVSMLSDEALSVRNFALRTLEERGGIFTEKEAEAHLVRQRPAPALGVGISRSEEGREEFDAFKERQYARRSERELEQERKASGFGADKSYFALCQRNPKKHLVSLRDNIDDGFSRFLGEYNANLRGAYSEKDTVALIDKLIADSEKYWKRIWMRKAMDIIVANGAKEDLGRVRKALDEDSVDPKKVDITFLEKHGSFEDIARICKIEADYRSGDGVAGLLSHVRARRRVARAALSLAKNNIVNLLASDLPVDVIPSVIAEARPNAFRELGASQLDELLFHSSQHVRKAAALKLLLTDSAAALRAKLTRYQNAEKYRFYNVIFWLDLGTAFPIRRARQIAAVEMLKIE